MQAVLIAAGESSRFWPLNNQHKSQIKIFGKPLLYWTIKSIAKIGIKDIVLVISPNSLPKEELLAIVQDLGVKLSFAIQKKPLGTGNAVFLAKEYIKDPFFVFWPYKIIAGEIAQDILNLIEKTKAEVVLTGSSTLTPWDFGILKMEKDKVVEIVENPEKGKEPSNIKVLGAYFLQPDFFEYYQKIKAHHPEDFIDALNLYIRDKKTSFLLLEKDIPVLKYPWELLEILKIMFRKSGFQSYISPSAIVGKNTVIEGNVYIGDDCQIGSNNVLRGPLNLEKNVKTGAFCEIKNSIIGEGTHFHSGYIGDSIIGENCRFGAGFITANRRIDRENIKAVVKGKKMDTGLTYLGAIVGNNTRFGIHSGTMPGVLIGPDCLIGPGTLVLENLENNSKFFTVFKSTRRR